MALGQGIGNLLLSGHTGEVLAGPDGRSRGDPQRQFQQGAHQEHRGHLPLLGANSVGQGRHDYLLSPSDTLPKNKGRHHQDCGQGEGSGSYLSTHSEDAAVVSRDPEEYEGQALRSDGDVDKGQDLGDQMTGKGLLELARYVDGLESSSRISRSLRASMEAGCSRLRRSSSDAISAVR